MEVSRILADLQEQLPYDVTFPEAPYSADITLEEKLNCAYRNLKRSIRLKSRTLSLINTYYLGKILCSVESLQLKQRISKHYVTIAEYTFDLFEGCPEQILRTKWISIQDIRRLKRSILLDLRNELIIFVGTQSLGEEIEDV